MRILPRSPRCQQPSDSSPVTELPLEGDISWSSRTRRLPKPTIHSRPATIHSTPAPVHLRQPVVHPQFASRLSLAATARVTNPRRSCAVSPLRGSAPFPDTKPHRRESTAHPRAAPRALRGSNSPIRRWGKGRDRRRSTGHGPRISIFRDEPSPGFLPRRFHGTRQIGLDKINGVDRSVAKV